MLPKNCSLLFFFMTTDVVICQVAPPPPAPPPPPRFMTMKGPPLSCFDKTNFEDDGLEFFVCNGGGGIVGVRKRDDPARTVFVRDPEIAQNLNMRAAKGECGNKKFAVSSDRDGMISFLCQGKELNRKERFKSASKGEWKRYDGYLK
jgi:hypothetical protein